MSEGRLLLAAVRNPANTPLLKTKGGYIGNAHSQSEGKPVGWNLAAVPGGNGSFETLEKGGDETRPRNVAVYFYIKVKWKTAYPYDGANRGPSCLALRAYERHFSLARFSSTSR